MSPFPPGKIAALQMLNKFYEVKESKSKRCYLLSQRRDAKISSNDLPWPDFTESSYCYWYNYERRKIAFSCLLFGPLFFVRTPQPEVFVHG